MRCLLLCCAILGVATLMAQVPDPRQGRGDRGSNIGTNQMEPDAGPGSFLGVRLSDVTADRARSLGLDDPKGAEVADVEPDTPAAKAGLKPGDVLLAYNGETILGAIQVGRLVRETPPGRKVKVQVWRDGHSLTVTVVTESPRQVPGQMSFAAPVRDFSLPDMPSAMLMWKSGMLGIYCESVDSQLAEYFGVKQGVLVRFVMDGSAAQRAGLKAGDVLTKVGDRVVASPRDVTVALHSQAYAGKPVSIVFEREPKETSLKVVLEDVNPLFHKLMPASPNQ